jgi:hypothetical protein
MGEGIITLLKNKKACSLKLRANFRGEMIPRLTDVNRAGNIRPSRLSQDSLSPVKKETTSDYLR